MARDLTIQNTHVNPDHAGMARDKTLAAPDTIGLFVMHRISRTLQQHDAPVDPPLLSSSAATHAGVVSCVRQVLTVLRRRRGEREALAVG